MRLLTVISRHGALKYLFLGDYVDRWPYSLEVILVIMALKISAPNNVILLRGNHETRQMASQHSFRQEVLSKQGGDQTVFEAFMDLFDCLPVACVLNGEYFCVHGGISPHVARLADLDRIERKVEVPLQGPLCDLLWSDPTERPDGGVPGGWSPNEVRGVAYIYGRDVTLPFLANNRLKRVFRAHECVFEGYQDHFWGNPTPVVTTVFSAPNYTDYYQNLASVAVMKNGAVKFEQFLSAPQPFHLHRSQGLFDFTLTILSTKLIESISHIYRRYYNEVTKDGSLTIAEIQDALQHVKMLEALEQNASAIESSLLNHDSIVDTNGQAVPSKDKTAQDKFFAAKFFDQDNESVFGRHGRRKKKSGPVEIPSRVHNSGFWDGIQIPAPEPEANFFKF